MQACLSFWWPGAAIKYQNRICEWFDVSGRLTEEVLNVLDEVYQGVPVDQTTLALSVGGAIG